MNNAIVLPECMKGIFIVFMLLLCSVPIKITKLKEDIINDPSECDSDWDEFGLCSRLTINEFKKFKGCEHYTDAEAEVIIEGLYKLSLISYNSYCNDKDVTIFISK